APSREDEDGDGSADLPFQDFHGRLFSATGRGVRGRGIAARRVGMFYRQRRFSETLARALPLAVIYQFAGVAADGEGTVDRRYGRVDRNDRYRAWRSGQIIPMELSPKLAAKFDKLQNSYPVKRSALI